MPFDSDWRAQHDAVRRNLADCAATSDPERAELAACIDGVVSGRDLAALGEGDISQIQKEIRDRVAARRWYLQGNVQYDAEINIMLHTRQQGSFENSFARGLVARDSSLSQPEASTIAAALVDDLQDGTSFVAARDAYGDVSFARHPSPVWAADPGSATPEHLANLPLLPARLGLGPNPGHYVLLTIRRPQWRSPRFADSGGYPYWRPGGVTLPIEQTPDGNSGFAEYVTHDLKLRDLTAPLQLYERII
jgi:hypothetical protein